MQVQPYIQQVADAKDNIYEQCLSFAENWLKNQTTVFTSENLIADFNKSETTLPKEPRVWGAVVQSLSRRKLITLIRYEPYKGKKGHGKPAAVWARSNAPVKSWTVPKIKIEDAEYEEVPQNQVQQKLLF